MGTSPRPTGFNFGPVSGYGAGLRPREFDRESDETEWAAGNACSLTVGSGLHWSHLCADLICSTGQLGRFGRRGRRRSRTAHISSQKREGET